MIHTRLDIDERWADIWIDGKVSIDGIRSILGMLRVILSDQL